MGYDATIFVKKKYSQATVTDLLLMQGYKKKKTSFYCGNDDEYKYLAGISIWLQDENEGEWIYQIRSQIWATGYDLKKMNDTLRNFRLYCDAYFISDLGKNRYFQEELLIKGAESGCYFAIERLINNFSLLKYALQKYPEDNEGEKMMHEMTAFPSANIFNANVYSTYLCSLIEEYFKSTYIALLKYSDRKEKIYSGKISPYDMADISDGKKSMEEVFTRSMSFQNIQKICSNFKGLDNKLDISEPLKQPYRRRKKSFYIQIDEILERRHGLIHRLEIDNEYNSEVLLKDIQDVTVAIKRVYTYLCHIYNWSVQTTDL